MILLVVMVKSIINENDLSKAEVVLLGAPYEKTASSHKGTAAGPAKVAEMLNNQIEFFDRNFKANVNDFVKTAYLPLKQISELPPEQCLAEIKKICDNLVAQDKFIFLLGGEHAVSLGLFQALAEKHNPKDVTILQIDAHCDLRNDDSDYSDTPSPLAHSAIMRRASELGYPIVQVGIRTYNEDEYKYFSDKKNNVTVFEWRKGAIPVEDILGAIKTKYLYITVDVDGFDPSVFPGTGTPVQGGLSWYYGVDFIEQSINKFELIGADIVEVSPEADTVQTEYGAAQLAYTMIANKFRSKLRS
ncbi:agmatinase [Candidatus Nomurabacteria bacterium RIFCSPLOWO2_02_FULL_44_12]|nr:MAG: agmatinase [Candidatus Nomurabacteria bacterium RIFCSPLOWO2_02_FULL_44_12]